MPYDIIKSGSGYFVENKETKERYSKKPISKSSAEKQKIAIIISESKKPKNVWLEHVDKVKKTHPDLSYKDVLQLAKKDYKK
jgi:hypothetical protein